MPNRKDHRAAAGQIAALYQTYATEFDRDRSRTLMEAPYLREILNRLGDRAGILDAGCGTGEPIARYFIEAGCRVTGIDAAPAMIEICRKRFPNATWIHCDMRSMKLGQRFDAVIAWDSFFHLPEDDQRRMFPVFQEHIAQGGMLLFTSGSRAGIAPGSFYGHELFHASLDTEEYESLLARHGFEVLLHRVEDPECGEHTVWLVQAHP